jgi:hypothetical protein
MVTENSVADVLYRYARIVQEALTPELYSNVTALRQEITTDCTTYRAEGVIFAGEVQGLRADCQWIMITLVDESGDCYADLAIQFSVMPEMIQISLHEQ